MPFSIHTLPLELKLLSHFQNKPAGHATREALLLDLEISLDLPSPAHVVEQRRERQLSRLRNRFATRTDEDLEPERLLVGCYVTPALPDQICELRLAEALRKMSDAATPHTASGFVREAREENSVA
jgi:hypothetical protein